MTAADFTDRKLSFKAICGNKQNNIRLNGLFNKSYITIFQNSGHVRVSKKSIYGYTTCNGNIYRFLDKKPLLLLNENDDIQIYKWILPQRPPYGSTNATNYYFSKGKEGDIQKLTFKNLKNAFVENPAFIQLVEKYFKFNTDLAEYDESNRSYRLTMLFKQTRK